MCSNVDADGLPELLQRATALDSNDKSKRTCRRCPNDSVVLLQGKDPHCRACFLEYCSHKFRMILGKHTSRAHSANVVRRDDRVLIAFSGGASSSALVDLIAQETDESKSFRRMLLRPALIFVDESDLLEEDVSKVDRIVERMHQTGWPSYYTSLKMATINDAAGGCFYVDSRETADLQRIRQISDRSCVNCIRQLKSLTAKEELIRRLRTQLIADVARLEGFNSVFLGSNATRLSAQLIADVAQGKGNQIHLETGFVDDRYEVQILKPLREFVSKEIAFYNRIRHIEFDETVELGTKQAVKSSLGRLSEAFVNGLQRDFPATVYTLFKIAEKVKSTPTTSAAPDKCDLCATRIDSDSGECSAQAALLLSQRLSRRSVADDDGQGGGSAVTMRPLCYGCLLIANELPSVDDMPEKTVRAAPARQIVQRFLIGHDDDDG